MEKKPNVIKKPNLNDELTEDDLMTKAFLMNSKIKFELQKQKQNFDMISLFLT